MPHDASSSRYDTMQRRAFDLANNYGPPPGSAEESLGRILRQDLAPYRDELVISTLLDRGIEAGLLETLSELCVGCIAFSPPAQGLTSDRYLGGGVPDGSRPRSCGASMTR